VAVLVGDHRGRVDGRLGVHVVGTDPDEDLARGLLGGHLPVGVVGPVERTTLEVLELVVGGDAGQAGLGVGEVGLQRGGVRPDVVVGQQVAGGVGAGGELAGAVAAAAGEDGHEEVDDAVLVGVEVGVVDLRVREDHGVGDQLAGRAAAAVDLLRR
jgi:hypothetical protein